MPKCAMSMDTVATSVALPVISFSHIQCYINLTTTLFSFGCFFFVNFHPNFTIFESIIPETYCLQDVVLVDARNQFNS